MMAVWMYSYPIASDPVSRTALLTMNAPLLPEVLMGTQPAGQAALALALASEGVQRFVWQSAFGPMLIEVRDGAAFVNGQRVLLMAELREAS
jgi:hypothetical protein